MSSIQKPPPGPVGPWYSGRVEWVKSHLQNVLGLPKDAEVVTYDLARDGVAQLGINSGVKAGFAAQIFAVAGNALASKTTSRQFFPPVVILDDVGLNHASSNSGIVRPGAIEARIDGRFDSKDLIEVLARGEYEDGVYRNSAFDSGDWDGDGEFDTRDLMFALQAGTYQQ